VSITDTPDPASTTTTSTDGFSMFPTNRGCKTYRIFRIHNGEPYGSPLFLRLSLAEGLRVLSWLREWNPNGTTTSSPTSTPEAE